MWGYSFWASRLDPRLDAMGSMGENQWQRDVFTRPHKLQPMKGVGKAERLRDRTPPAFWFLFGQIEDVYEMYILL